MGIRKLGNEAIGLRFIGGKKLLLDNIQQIIEENTSIDSRKAIFCDIFSGSNAVSRHFKNKYLIYSNDLLYMSFVLQKATIENNEKPTFEKLSKSLGVQSIFQYLEKESFDIEEERLFVLNNYSPHKNCNRMYFTEKNAKRIDFIRIKIEEWRHEKTIEENEYFYLLACLLESVPFFSNISGTYGAYLKHWDKRALKDFKLTELDVFNNQKENKSFNKDSNELINEISGTILYLDPPYNQRQYLPNYHVLETIARYDYPEVNGVTGIRQYGEKDKSMYCKKAEALSSLSELFRNADFKYIVLSYNNEGIISEEEIEEILTEHSKTSLFIKKRINYRKYKGKKEHVTKDQLYELLYLVERR
jgi:adenine-specific DNA-methyltransferase